MEIKEIIQRMDSLKTELDQLRPISEDRLIQLNQKLRLDWNYHSNSIEGNTLTASETKAFILHGITAKGKPFRDYVEMRGHNEALKKLEQIVHKDLAITENLIKEFHKIILVEEFADGEAEINPGHYKTKPNYLYTPEKERIDFKEPAMVPQAMNELINWLNNHIDPPKRSKKKYDLHPLLIASIFHWQFIQIHPFGDGNGRMARILMNLILMLCGYAPAIVKTEKRLAYYGALNLSDETKITPLAEFIGEECIASLELTLKAAKGEQIEEAGDLEKQIDVWKRQLETPKEEVLPKSDTQIHQIFNQGLRRLFILYHEKIKIFDDLFAAKDIMGFVNGANQENKDFRFIEEEFMRWKNNPTNAVNGYFNTISLSIRFKGFKKNGKNVFDQSSSITINFEPFVYLIYINNQLTADKLYSEFIDDKSAMDIIERLVAQTFAEIKEKSGTKE